MFRIAPRRRVLSAVPALLVLSLVACGCGSRSDEGQGQDRHVLNLGGDSESDVGSGSASVAPSQDADRSSSDPRSTSVPDADSPTLTDAGDAPRSQLRLSPSEGDRETSTMRMELQSSAFGSIAVPAITMELDTEVAEMSGDEITLRQQLGDVRAESEGVDHQTLTAMQRAFDQMEGIVLTSTIDTRGHLLTADIAADDLPEQIQSFLDQFKDQMRGLVLRFPDEEVGVGAVWSTTSTASLSGAEVRQTSEYRLVSVEGDRYQIEVTSTQTYLPSSLDGARITEGSGQASGTITGDLSVVNVLRSDASGSTSFTIESRGQTQTVSTTTKMSAATEID